MSFYEKRKPIMKNKLPIIAIVMIFLVGLGILSYPLISAAINNLAARNQAEEYTKLTKEMPSDRQGELLQSAHHGRALPCHRTG